MTKCKDIRLIDYKPRWIVIDEKGEIINRSPSKDDLKKLEKTTHKAKKRCNIYTEEELLNFLRQFHCDNSTVPKYGYIFGGFEGEEY